MLQTSAPDGPTNWQLFYQLRFKQQPEGTIWISIETERLYPSKTTKTIWGALSRIMDLGCKFLLKVPWRWNYGTDTQRGYVQFRLCDSHTLVEATPGDTIPDLRTWNCEENCPGIDTRVRKHLAFQPGHTYTAAIWTRFFDVRPWAVVDVPGLGKIPLQDHIGCQSVNLCLRHDTGDETQQECLVDMVVYNESVHPEVYQRYAPSKEECQEVIADAQKRQPSPAKIQVTSMKGPMRQDGSQDLHVRLAALLVLALWAASLWRNGSEVAAVGLAAAAAIFLVLTKKAPDADHVPASPRRRAPEMAGVTPRSTPRSAPPPNANRMPAPAAGCFGNCLPVGALVRGRPKPSP